MKSKVLSTALILGSLYGTANASVSLTSPLYQASKGELKTEVSLGYTKNMWDKVSGLPGMPISTLENKGGNVNLEGQYGLTDYLALNYGVSYNLTQRGNVYTLAKYKASPEFKNYYLGLTGKLYDCGKQKAYLTLNVGQNDNYMPSDFGVSTVPNTYFDLSLKYGLDLNNYNVALSVGGIYDMSYTKDVSIAGEAISNKAKSTQALYTKLENEVKLGKVNLGLDLYYLLQGSKYNIVYMPGDDLLLSNANSYNEYGVSLTADYALNDGMYLGLYGSLYKNDKEELILDTGRGTGDIGGKKEYGYTYGVKLTKSF